MSFTAHTYTALIVNIGEVTGRILYNIKIMVMRLLWADYRINSDTNLLVQRSNMSMTWRCRLQGIGAGHCNELKPHGRDWKHEVSGCENHVREVVERTKTERESQGKRETRSLVSCSQRPSCCSFHYSNAAAWHWLNTATGKHGRMRACAANAALAGAAKANKRVKRCAVREIGKRDRRKR